MVFVELRSHTELGCCSINDSFEIIAFGFPLQGGTLKRGWFWERGEGTERQLINSDLFRYSAMIRGSSIQAFWHIELTDYSV